MTRLEFHGQFVRLCKGFKYDATMEQTDAWFRRVGHVGLEPWAEAVTNLLCADRFPRDLDAVLKVVDLQAHACRAKAIQRDKPRAARLEAQLGAAGCGIDPALFRVIKAYSGCDQVRLMQQRVIANEDMPPTAKRLELARLRTEEARLMEEIKQGVPLIDQQDAMRLVEQYEPKEVPA